MKFRIAASAPQSSGDGMPSANITSHVTTPSPMFTSVIAAR
jgi:hypothetical protein